MQFSTSSPLTRSLSCLGVGWVLDILIEMNEIHELIRLGGCVCMYFVQNMLFIMYGVC